jgi:hypothetical protein
MGFRRFQLDVDVGEHGTHELVAINAVASGLVLLVAETAQLGHFFFPIVCMRVSKKECFSQSLNISLLTPVVWTKKIDSPQKF